MEHIRKFLLEIGSGFAFVVLELKATEFQPEFIGKMNFYLAVVDDTLRHESNAPSIGLLLCRKKQALTVEYSLRNVATPIAVSEFVTDLAHRIEAELNATGIPGSGANEHA